MDLDEFRKDFLNEAAAWAASDLNFRHSSFVEVAIRHLEEAGEVADFEPCYYRGTGSRRRALAVDGYAFDEADGSLRLFLADPSMAETAPTLTQTEARALFGKLRAFTEDAADRHLDANVDPSSPAYGLATELARRLPELSRIRAYLLTDAVLSSRAGDWPEGEISGVPVESHIWDIARFHRIHTSRSGRDDLVVDLSEVVDGGLPCLEAGTDSEEYSAYLCVVPGRILAEIYEEYGSRLLEGNVRSFLTAKGRVNKGIRNTILHEADKFFAYNNGIAATASKVSLSQTDQGLRLLSATDLQIVNGAQTTASLAAAMRNDKESLERVFVPMKLSVVSAERSGEMIPLISRYANSQNKVSDADFFSNHEYHRRLEQISRRSWAPARTGAQHETHWFYERARGQYMNETAALTPGDRRRFIEMNPRDQVVTKTDLAKSENSWRQLPHIVSRGAQKNFLDFASYVTAKWEGDADAFHEDYFRSVVARVMIFRATERLVSSQPWYSGGYRANVVAYTLAKLALLIQEMAPGKQLDTRAVWQRQALTASLTMQLASIARAVHEVITDPPPGTQNVTEWSKKESCWERAKSSDVRLLSDFEAELCPIEETRAADRAARAQQRQDSGISAQETVIQLGREYWSSARTWAQERQLLPPEEDRLLRLAAGLAQGLPTDRQSVRLLQMKARMEAEGLAPPTLLGVAGQPSESRD